MTIPPPPAPPSPRAPAIVGQVPVDLVPTDLGQARVGQRLRIVGIAGDDQLAQRLRASGLWDGTEIELLGKAPFGDPLLFKLHGFRLALRGNEAERVLVAPLEAPQ